MRARGILAATVGGAVVGVLAAGAGRLAAGSVLLALGGALLVVLLGYVVANASGTSGVGEFVRGLLIGLNTALNVLLALAVYSALLGPAPGAGLAALLGVLNFLTAFDPVANNEVFQGLLGWANWLLPMSWLVVGLGLLFWVANTIGHAIGTWIFGSDFFRVKGVGADWKTGTFFMHGGWISNLNYLHTAFNMGCFAFVDRASAHWFIEHEAGHSLNLAAFGSLFHFLGAIDENVTGGHQNAYAERLAESNNPAPRWPNIIPMWI